MCVSIMILTVAYIEVIVIVYITNTSDPTIITLWNNLTIVEVLCVIRILFIIVGHYCLTLNR